jgi:hypothetical protein
VTGLFLLRHAISVSSTSPFGRHGAVALDHLALDLDRAAHCMDDALKLHEQTVAGRLYDAAAMFNDSWIEQFAPDRFLRRERAFLVGVHQPRISDDIRGQDRSRSSLDPCSPLGLHEGDHRARIASATANPGRWTKPALDGVPGDGNVII